MLALTGILLLALLVMMTVIIPHPSTTAVAQGNRTATPLPTSTQPSSAFLNVNVLADSSDGVCDQNHCSLRDAITEANQLTGKIGILLPAGTILFDVADNDGTVDGGNVPNALPIVQNSIEIFGTGGTVLEIDGSAHPMRFFETNAQLKLFSVTLKNGNAGSGNGGAIYSKGPLIGFQTGFENNQANNGGAIYQASADHVAFDESRFLNNSATTAGGAIARPVGAQVFNRLALLNSDFFENTAGERGGAFYSNGNIDVSGSRFVGNVAEAGIEGQGHVYYTDATGPGTLQTIYDNCITANGTEVSPHVSYTLYSNDGVIEAGYNWWGGTDDTYIVPFSFNASLEPILIDPVADCPNIRIPFALLKTRSIDFDLYLRYGAGRDEATFDIFEPPANGTLEKLDVNPGYYRYTYNNPGGLLPPIVDQFTYAAYSSDGAMTFGTVEIARLNGDIYSLDGVTTASDVITIINRIGAPIEDYPLLDLNVNGQIDAGDAEILIPEIGSTVVLNPVPTATRLPLSPTPTSNPGLVEGPGVGG
ncbi:MAG: CSLREA domain-containing protein [Chloroflexota bacterium]